MITILDALKQLESKGIAFSPQTAQDGTAVECEPISAATSQDSEGASVTDGNDDVESAAAERTIVMTDGSGPDDAVVAEAAFDGQTQNTTCNQPAEPPADSSVSSLVTDPIVGDLAKDGATSSADTEDEHLSEPPSSESTVDASVPDAGPSAGEGHGTVEKTAGQIEEAIGEVDVQDSPGTESSDREPGVSSLNSNADAKTVRSDNPEEPDAGALLDGDTLILNSGPRVRLKELVQIERFMEKRTQDEDASDISLTNAAESAVQNEAGPHDDATSSCPSTTHSDHARMPEGDDVQPEHRADAAPDVPSETYDDRPADMSALDAGIYDIDGEDGLDLTRDPDTAADQPTQAEVVSHEPSSSIPRAEGVVPRDGHPPSDASAEMISDKVDDSFAGRLVDLPSMGGEGEGHADRNETQPLAAPPESSDPNRTPAQCADHQPESPHADGSRSITSQGCPAPQETQTFVDAMASDPDRESSDDLATKTELSLDYLESTTENELLLDHLEPTLETGRTSDDLPAAAKTEPAADHSEWAAETEPTSGHLRPATETQRSSDPTPKQPEADEEEAPIDTCADAGDGNFDSCPQLSESAPSDQPNQIVQPTARVGPDTGSTEWLSVSETDDPDDWPAPTDSAQISAVRSPADGDRPPDGESTSGGKYEQSIVENLLDDAQSKPYAQILHGLVEALPNGLPAAIMVVGSQPEPHVAQTLAHMAVLLVQRDAGGVLLVDAGLPKKTLSQRFQVEDKPGLAETCRAEKDWRELLVPGTNPNLSILPVGTGPTPPMTTTSTLARLVDEWKKEFPVVLVDAGETEAPLTEALAQSCDSVYLLVRLGQTGRKQAQATVARLRSMCGNLDGCIVTNAPTPPSN